MKILATRFGIIPALLTAALAACTTPQPPVNTLCSGIQIEQDGRLVESDGLSVTIKRAPFTIHNSAAAQEPFRLHANERASPMVVYLNKSVYTDGQRRALSPQTAASCGRPPFVL